MSAHTTSPSTRARLRLPTLAIVAGVVVLAVGFLELIPVVVTTLTCGAAPHSTGGFLPGFFFAVTGALDIFTAPEPCVFPARLVRLIDLLVPFTILGVGLAALIRHERREEQQNEGQE